MLNSLQQSIVLMLLLLKLLLSNVFVISDIASSRINLTDQSSWWLRINYPTRQYALSPQLVIDLHGSVVV